ncbi:hypothetical protein RZS08_45380, partial [Arthrospira platensis SPKY1]|nr:hypothetical protein [Arthrospira platensis SPKY1]
DEAVRRKRNNKNEIFIMVFIAIIPKKKRFDSRRPSNHFAVSVNFGLTCGVCKKWQSNLQAEAATMQQLMLRGSAWKSLWGFIQKQISLISLRRLPHFCGLLKR